MAHVTFLGGDDVPVEVLQVPMATHCQLLCEGLNRPALLARRPPSRDRLAPHESCTVREADIDRLLQMRGAKGDGGVPAALQDTVNIDDVTASNPCDLACGRRMDLQRRLGCEADDRAWADVYGLFEEVSAEDSGG